MVENRYVLSFQMFQLNKGRQDFFGIDSIGFFWGKNAFCTIKHVYSAKKRHIYKRHSVCTFPDLFVLFLALEIRLSGSSMARVRTISHPFL